MLHLVQLTLLIAVTIPLATATILFGLFDSNGKSVYRLNQFWTWSVLRIARVSLKIRGLENIDPGQQYVFMVNHQSNIDIPVLVQSLTQFQLRWIAKKELLWVPLFGWAMWATKHITVDRNDPTGARKSLERAKRRIAAGISVVVFPEGTRGRNGRLLPFKKGGFLLALQTGKNIVPITLNGSGQILPSGDWRFRPGIVEVIVEKPIITASYRAGTLRSLSDQVRQAIAAHLLPMETTFAGDGETITSPHIRPAWQKRQS
jgi:1-acyl-sn-glycerol-3-phosphate acyltransferase